MSSSIHQAQDKLFKQAMSNIKVATDFFQAHLPQEILEQSDLTTLRLEKNSFVDDSFKNLEADVIYQVKIKEKDSFFYLLCENQSEVDPMIAFRLLVYTVDLLKFYRKQHPKSSLLPVVYPLVVYSGEKPWDAPRVVFDLFHQPALAKAFFLNAYQLIDICRVQDEALRQRTLSGIVEFALKNKRIYDLEKFLKSLFPWLNEVEIQAGSDFAKIILRYTANSLDAHGKDLYLEKANNYLSSNLQGEVMTLAQEFREEGIKVGVQQGLQQGEYSLLLRQLQRKFDTIPDTYQKKLSEADAETLLVWGERILEAKTLEDIFKN